MKFDCNKRHNRKKDWHWKFLFFPRQIDGYCYWLQWVERKGTYWYSWAASGWDWEYRNY